MVDSEDSKCVPHPAASRLATGAAWCPRQTRTFYVERGWGDGQGFWGKAERLLGPEVMRSKVCAT